MGEGTRKVKVFFDWNFYGKMVKNLEVHLFQFLSPRSGDTGGGRW
jgi:hypothetical protein